MESDVSIAEAAYRTWCNNNKLVVALMMFIYIFDDRRDARLMKKLDFVRQIGHLFPWLGIESAHSEQRQQWRQGRTTTELGEKKSRILN